jgi:hypothetical protein
VVLKGQRATLKLGLILGNQFQPLTPTRRKHFESLTRHLNQ